MEDTLREGSLQCMVMRDMVLILVLMEDTLRDRAKPKNPRVQRF